MNMLSLRDELMLLRAECLGAMKDVASARDISKSSYCDCRLNSIKAEKFGFVVGYTLSVVERLLKAMHVKAAPVDREKI